MKKNSLKWWTLFAVGLTSVIVAIDFTIVNTVLADIQQDLKVNMNALQWVMTGFGITFSAFLIPMGKLGDLLGRRKVLYVGMLGFALASLGAGLSTSIHALTSCRLLQGMFGACMFPCGLGITASVFGEHERGRAIGIYGSMLGIGLAIGPVLGGIIATLSSWRWIFFINLPYIFLCFVICFFIVHESRAKTKTMIDWLGMFLTVVTLSATVFAVTQGQVYGLTSPYILISLTLAIVCLISLYFTEKNTSEPLLPPELFLNRYFLIGSLIYCICVGLVWTIVFFVPLYLQNVFNLSEMQTGLYLLPMTVMTIVAPAMAGYLFDKDGPLVTTVLAFGLSIVGLILLYLFGLEVSPILILFAFVCIGLSWGIGNGIALPVALSSPANRENESLVSGAAVTTLNIFGVFLLAVSSALFHFLQQRQLFLQGDAVHAFRAGFHGILFLLLTLTVIALIIVLVSFKKSYRRSSHKKVS